MSSFGAKRKARVIKIADEDVPGTSDSADVKSEVSKPTFGVKSGRKPLRQSGLRKPLGTEGDGTKSVPDDDGDQDDGPVVVRPVFNRNSSSSQRKRTPKTSKLSFAEGQGQGEDDDDTVVKPVKKAPLGKRALENSAMRRGISSDNLPVWSFRDEDADDRPRYSKEYLNELQSSTPNTPADAESFSVGSGDAMEIDSSELEGALIVDTPASASPKPETSILTEAEIREKKERRARLAKEQDFLSVEDDEDDEDRLSRKKKDDSRLKPEEEELGEGFDDYVEDGGLSLGKRAEKERRKKERQQMAELITAAEGHSSDSSADSDAERRMAYEAAQSRAGMDGLKKPRKDPAEELLKVPPKITPLPNLSECIQKLQASLQTMEVNLQSKSARVEQLRKEREEITTREGEVQTLLDETGKKYQEAMGQGKVENGTVKSSGPGAELVGERGLESMGTTPRRNESGEASQDEEVDHL